MMPETYWKVSLFLLAFVTANLFYSAIPSMSYILGLLFVLFAVTLALYGLKKLTGYGLAFTFSALLSVFHFLFIFGTLSGAVGVMPERLLFFYFTELVHFAVSIALLISIYKSQPVFKAAKPSQRFELRDAGLITMGILVALLFFSLLITTVDFFPLNPVNETKQILSLLVDQPGAIMHTKKVVFNSGSVLPGRALEERIPINSDQICMSLGEFKENVNGGFECIDCDGNEQHRIIWHGITNQLATIAVVCNTNLSLLEKDIETYGLENFDNGTNDITSNCRSICSENAMCCAIVLK